MDSQTLFLHRPSRMDSSHAAGTWEHPPSFYCPISQQCMHDPVVLSDGQSYERRHIERWLLEQSSSPVTGLQLSAKDVFPNHALRNAIEEYFKQVFCAHRRAIRNTMSDEEPGAESSLGSNVSLLRTIDALMQCSLLMNADLSTESVLRRITDEAMMLVGAEVASVFLVDSAKQELYSNINSTGGELRIPITAGIAGHVATTGEPVVIQDTYGDKRFSKQMDAKTGFKTRNMMCVPLKVKRGGVIGVVQLINKTSTAETETFSADDLQFLQVFASQAATAVATTNEVNDPISHEPDQLLCLPSPVKTCVGERSEMSQQHDLPGQRSKIQDPENAPQPIAKVAGEGISRKGLHLAQIELPARTKCADSKVSKLLSGGFDAWQLDTLALAEATDNMPLSTLGNYLFEHLGLVDHFCLDQQKLSRFFEHIECGYDNGNPYHNRAHAASVMHTMHALLQHGELAQAVAGSSGGSDDAEEGGCQIETMACLLAAAMHDYEHLGLSNDFLIRTNHERALAHNDQHVNEHHHSAGAFAVMMRPECNFLTGMPAEDFRRLRGLIIDLILGTDMSSHGALIKSFTQTLDSSAVADKSEGAGSGARAALSFHSPSTPQDAMLLLQVAMKCADIGHLALEWTNHVQWVGRLEAEFFAQGDREQALGLPISFLMDRTKPGLSETQTGFFDFMVLPLFRALVRAAPSAQPMLSAVEENRQRWHEIEEAKKSDAQAESHDMVTRSDSKTSVSTETSFYSEASPGGSQLSTQKRSGRARQRAAKFWRSVRAHTPSPREFRSSDSWSSDVI